MPQTSVMDCESNVTASQKRTKLAPKTIAKKLPWLDGKSSQVASVTAPTRRPSAIPQTASLSPLIRIPTAQQTSFARLGSISTSSINCNSKSSPTESINTQGNFRDQSPSQLVVSHGDFAQPSEEHNDFSINTPRTSSLKPVPDHLKSTETPKSIREIAQGNERVGSPLMFVNTARISPQPIPGRDPFEGVHNKGLSDAIEGLEDMVQEAVTIAKDTANPSQAGEIYQIIEDAKNALEEASAEPHRILGPNSPLQTIEFVAGSSGLSSAPISQFDWGYQRRKEDSEGTSSSSSLSPSEAISREQHHKFGTSSELLLPPQPAQNPERDHVDILLQPVLREDSNCSQHPYRRNVLKVDKHKETRHMRHRCTENDNSRHYGNELHVREQAHHHIFSLRRRHRRQPIARDWGTRKKRMTASVACVNTALLGIIVGIYAGEVPRIQYMLADERHHVIVGNILLYLGLAISTFIVWPLPLLHGRKPYILSALALALPLQFPQAIVVGSKRSPKNPTFRTGLLCARAMSGLVLGFANVNYITVLLDLFGASLQSRNPHQEIPVVNDARRHGGGMGVWLGIWSWCWIGSLAIGFQIGAGLIETLTPDWGFYIVIIILAFALILNIITPETRRAPYRKSITELYDCDENYITRRVSCGEIKLHISTEGPIYWFEEVWAGMKLATMMIYQPGFFVLSFYLGWIYAQIILVIVLLGALLSRDYKWHPRFVGLGVMSIAIGALLAIPLTKAGIFSRERRKPFRTDSMTFEKRITWSSHLVRRIVFTLALPLMGLAYTVSSAGRPKPYMVPIMFAGAVGFLSLLAIAECHGLIMETFDTCDLQPGVNTKHRLQSMAVQDRRRRTNYSSFPRVTAGIFASQTLAFIGAAMATGIGGMMTRHIGAQASTGVTAGILLGLTILLTAVLWRFRKVQVIPNHTFGTRRDTKA